MIDFVHSLLKDLGVSKETRAGGLEQFVPRSERIETHPSGTDSKKFDAQYASRVF